MKKNYLLTLFLTLLLFSPQYLNASFQSNLPLLVLHTFGQQLSLTQEIEAKVRVYYNNETSYTYTLNDLSFEELDVRVRIRFENNYSKN